MSESIQINSIEGQRWDQLAHDAYGNAEMMNAIIEANPDIPIYDKLPGGLVINLPIVASVDVKTDAEKLPPWKR